jgi:hypothetical protein
MKGKFIIVRYFLKGLKPSAQYYSTNAAQNSHFWSPSDANAKIFTDLNAAREAESLGYNEEFMTNILQFNDALKTPADRGIWSFAELLQKAQECGLKNYH